MNQLKSLWRAKAHGNTPLSPIEAQVINRFAAQKMRRHAARLIWMIRVLDADNVCSEIGQHKSAERSSQEMSQVENANAFMHRVAF